MRFRVLAAGLTASALAGLGLWLAASALAIGPEPQRWTEASWPFPRDAWPAGRAFRCARSSCGQDIVLYVRPKLGFCNCVSGVTEDAEVDGVSDLDLLAPDYWPTGPGTGRRIGDLPGRSRTYSMTLADGGTAFAAGIAVSRGCDLVAVAALSATPIGEAALSAAVGFLASAGPMSWLRRALEHP
ncbi:MAG: hypothetical protein HYR63_07160 [Proteobacteria bacterium]|nr:hypothetical protein [Pseudomonadota bacterium]